MLQTRTITQKTAGKRHETHSNINVCRDLQVHEPVTHLWRMFFSKVVGQGKNMAVTLFLTTVRLSHMGVGQGWDTRDNGSHPWLGRGAFGN